VVSVPEIRELCLEELRKCEQTSEPAERRRHAVRAMNFARLAGRMEARLPKELREPLGADFLAALNGILNRLSENMDLSLPDPDLKPPSSE